MNMVVCATCHECVLSRMPHLCPGKVDVTLHVIPEEGSGVTIPNPSEDQGEEPQKELPPVEVVSEKPATEDVHIADSEKMDLAETTQVEQTGEPSEQVPLIIATVRFRLDLVMFISIPES